jgi:hypothetical protein
MPAVDVRQRDVAAGPPQLVQACERRSNVRRLSLANADDAGPAGSFRCLSVAKIARDNQANWFRSNNG